MNDECVKNHVENENHIKIMRKIKNALRSILSMARHGLCSVSVCVLGPVIDGWVLSFSSIFFFFSSCVDGAACVMS